MTLLDDEQKYAEIFTDTERWGRRSQRPNTRRRGTAQLSFMVSINQTWDRGITIFNN